ncbi:hypothetical protein LM594_04250 [Candidatus Caldipriscus sp.]|nr:hypothetical protein [Candidatus Caldipriscus sp.]
MLHLSEFDNFIALLPVRGSDYAVKVDTAFWITFFLSLIFFVIINFALLVFIIKYGRKKGDEEPGAPIRFYGRLYPPSFCS